MSEKGLSHIKDLKQLKNGLWIGVITMLQGFEDNHIIFLLLTLKKKGILKKLLESGQALNSKNIELLIQNAPDIDKSTLIKIVSYYSNFIDATFGQSHLNKLINLLETLDQQVIEESFSEIFEDLLSRYSKLYGREFGESILPAEISRFMCNLISLPENAKIYNPFAGIASFDIFSNKSQYYLGQEINKITWAIGTLRIIANERITNSKFILGDSINEWQVSNEKYDLIISNPPYGMRLPNNITGMFGNIRTAEQFVIEKGIESLKSDGKLVVCVSQGLLFHSDQVYSLKKYLIENDLLEMVISLPGGLLTNTGISTTIIVIDKNKKDKGKVRFIDTINFVETSSREKKLNDSALNAAIRSSDDSEMIKIVSNETIESNNFNLNVPRYFLKEIEDLKFGEKIVTLQEVAAIIRGQRITDGQKGKFVRIRNLQDDNLDYNLDVDQLEEIELPRFAQRIEESCLILAVRWKTLKPTYFSYNGTPIFISHDTIALKVDESKILLSYLINELHAGYVNEQMEANRVGAVIPAIRKDDLLKIKIKIPELLEQQKNIMNAVVQALADEKKKELILFSKIHGLENELIEQNTYLRHTLVRPASNVKGSFANIKTIILDKLIPEIPSLMNIKISDKHELNFGQYLEIIEREINKIVESVSNKLKVETNIESIILKPIELISYLQNFVKEYKDREDIKFEIKFDYDEIDFADEESVTPAIYILATEELLTDLLNNLISNAIAHAFVTEGKHRIEIYLMKTTSHHLTDFGQIQTDKVQILFSNTGASFPEDFSMIDFIRKGAKSGNNAGDGFGGWYIYEIVKKLNGSFDIIDERGPEGLPDTDFATSFEIDIPIYEDLNQYIDKIDKEDFNEYV